LDQTTGTAGLDLAAQLKNEYIHGVASDLSLGSFGRHVVTASAENGAFNTGAPSPGAASCEARRLSAA